MRIFFKIFLLSITFFGESTFSLANTESLQANERHWVFSTIDKYDDYLKNPLMGAINGATGAGLHGALAGASLGVLDDTLIFDYPHFTSGMLGYAIISPVAGLHNFAPMAGFTTGTLASMLLPDSVKSYGHAPIQGAIAGHVVAGSRGMLVGACWGFVDEALVAFGFTSEKHLTQALSYLTLTMVASNLIASLPKVGTYYKDNILAAIDSFENGRLVVASAISLIIRTILEHDEGQTVVTSPFDLANELKETMSGIIDKNELRKILREQALVLASTQVASTKLSQSLAGHHQTFHIALSSLGIGNRQKALSNFYTALLQIVLFLGPYIVYEIFFVNIVNYHYENELSKVIQDALNKKYLEGETPLKLSGNPENEVLIDKMNDNINKVTHEGSELISKAVNAYIGGAYNVFYLTSLNALDIAILLNAYNKATEEVSVALNKDQLKYKEKIKSLESKISLLQKDIKQNAKTIITGNKKDFIAEKQNELTKEMRTVKDSSQLFTETNFGWMEAKAILDITIQFVAITKKISLREVPFDQLSPVLAGTRKVSKALSWYSDNSDSITEVQQAANATKSLLKEINKKSQTNAISASYSINHGSENAIYLENFSIGHSGATLLNPQTLEIPLGIYSVTGASGSGKSSFLSKIQGIKHNGIWATGNITYSTKDGTRPIIHQATQEDYIAPYSSLLEILTSMRSKEIPKDPNLRNKVIELLKEIQIDDKGDYGILSQIDDTEIEWHSILSGGQKKKVSVIETIIRNPDIAILDEIFAGLDPKSVRNIQGMLKKHLPNALLLIVDHNVEQNNYNKFYKMEINLSGKQLFVNKL